MRKSLILMLFCFFSLVIIQPAFSLDNAKEKTALDWERVSPKEPVSPPAPVDEKALKEKKALKDQEEAIPADDKKCPAEEECDSCDQEGCPVHFDE